MSQTALAGASGITQASVSKYELGLAVPSDAVLDRMTEVLHCPPSLLRQPLRFQQLPLTFFRKRSRVGVRDTKAIRAQVNLFAWRLEILLDSYTPVQTKITFADTDERGMSAVKAAQRLRVYWNVPPGPILDVTHLVESYGIVIVPVDFGTEAVDGLSLYDPQGPLPPIIFLNPRMPPDRWRLNLVHELGHIVIHHHRNIPPDERTIEKEAFDFAVELLMPQREIRGHLRAVDMRRLGQLKAHWRVSMAAILKRATDLGYVSRQQATPLWVRLRSGGVKHEPVSIAPEQATTIRQIVDYYERTLKLSVSDFSELLHQSPDEVVEDWGVGRRPLQLT